MRHYARKRNQALGKRILLLATIWLCALCVFLLLPPAITFAVPPNPQTTVADFNAGQFYHTGLTRTTAGGGDGDGEVRLMTVGIPPSAWYSNGNVTNLPALNGHAAVQVNDRIYVSGGRPLPINPAVSHVYFTTINTSTDHNLANWTETTPLTGTRWAHGMVVVNNFVYVIGGYEGVTPMATVLYAPITAGGVGTWSVATGFLPTALAESATVVVNGWIYVIGGFSSISGPVDTVYYARPDSSGNISGWAATTQPLPRLTQLETAAVDNGAIYVMGGKGKSASNYPNVYYGIPNSSTGDITAWSADLLPLQNNLILASSASFGGQLYVAGGAYNNGSILTKTIESNLIDMPSRTFSLAWTESNVLSVERERAPAVMSTDGWLYVIEGTNSTTDGTKSLNSIDYGPTVSVGSNQYAPSGTYTSPVIDLGSSVNITGLDWNATIANASLASMAVSYRIGDTSDLSGVFYSTPVLSAPGTQITNTITLPTGTYARYIQYSMALATSLPTLTPVLNSVYIKYTALPDFIVSNIIPPVLGTSSTPVTETINIIVGNLAGGANFNAPLQRSTTAIVTQQSGPRGAPRIPPSGFTSPPTNTGPTYTYIFVDLYVDPAPGFVKPTNAGDLGNCPTQSGGASYPTIQHLAAGTWVNVPYHCWLTPNQVYTFYAQVDTCDDPAQSRCTFANGYIIERNEHNNIFGPLTTPLANNIFFMPFIRR